MPAELRVAAFPGEGPGASLLPAPAADTAPFHRGLGEAKLMLQACASCGAARYPVAPVCPYCHATAFAWRHFDGGGAAHSWARYHRCFHPAFAALVPYTVVAVQLDAGPRMFGRLRGAAAPAAGARMSMLVERWEDGACSPAFEPQEPEEPEELEEPERPEEAGACGARS